MDDYDSISSPVGGDAPTPDMSITPEQYFSAIKQYYPNAVFNGGGRTPGRNKAVGGVPNSMHLSDQAVDFNVPGVPSQQVFDTLKSHNLPMTEELSEGQVGSQGAHLHVGWRPKGQQADNYDSISSPVDPKTNKAIGGSASSYDDISSPVPPQPNALERGVMDLSNSKFIKGISGAYDQAVTNGLFMQPTRFAMEHLGVGMDELKKKFPGQTEDWYHQQLHTAYNGAVEQARQNAVAQTKANPYPGHLVGNTLAEVAGSPEYLLAPGGGVGTSVGRRIASAVATNAAVGAASNAAAQGMDILEGQKKDFDITQNLTQAAFAGGIGGAVHGATEFTPVVSDYVKSLFANRGVDTKPGALPLGSTSPTTGPQVNLTPEEQQTFKGLVQHGSVDDIKAFLASKQGPKPSWSNVNQLVQLRDSLPPKFVGRDNLNEAINQHIADTNTGLIHEHLQQQTAGWKNAPDFEVINHADDIQDPNIRAQAQKEDANGDALGFLGPDGKVRIYGSRIDSPETLNAVLFHEGLGHFGLSEKFGDRLDQTLGTLLDRNVGQFGKDVDAWQKKNPGAYDGDRVRAAEEVLAERSQNGQVKSAIWDAVSASVRQFGRKMGLKLSYNDSEVRHILAMSHDAVVNGTGRNVAANGYRNPLNNVSNKHMFTGQKARGFDVNHPTTFTPSDNIIRNEINDQRAELTGMQMGTLGGVLDHPELYKHYPELRNLRVIHTDLNGYRGAYSDKTRTLYLDNTGKDTDPLSTVLHETQHAIQHIEGFHPDQPQDTSALTDEEYLNSPIEKEARQTEYRQRMSDFQRRDKDRLYTSNGEPVFMRRNALDEEQVDPRLLDHVDQFKQDLRFWSDPEFRKNVIELARLRNPVDTSPKEEPKAYRFASEAEARQALGKFMRKSQLAAEPGMDSGDPEAIHNALEKMSAKTVIPWEQTKREALEAGFKPSQIKDLSETNPGDLTNKVWRIGAATNMAKMKLDELSERIGTPDERATDKYDALQATATFQYNMARFKGELSEAARALQAAKAFMSYTDSGIEKMMEALRDSDSPLADIAGDPLKFAQFWQTVKNMLGSNSNPQGLATVLQATNKPYWEQYLNTLHMNMMLSAFSTHVKAPIDMATGITRNVMEKAMAMPIGEVRKMIVRMTGRAPKPGVEVAELLSHTYGLMKSVSEAEVYRRMLHAVKTGEGGYVDANGQSVPLAIQSKYLGTTNPDIPGVSIPSHLIAAQDTFFRSVEMNAQLRALASRQARVQLGKNASLDDMFTRTEAIARAPSASMLKEARDLTDRTLLLNSNIFNKFIDQGRHYRPGMSVYHRAGTFVVSNLAPFIRVEANNLFNRVIQRSPLGLLDPYTLGQLKLGGPQADIAAAKMIYGSVLIGMAWVAADKAKNYITGEGPENPYKLKELMASGYSPNAIHENGQYQMSSNLSLSVNPFDYHNEVAQQVAAARQAWEAGADEHNWGTALKLAFGSVMHSLGSMTWLNDLAPVTDAATAKGQDATGKLTQFVANEARTWTPMLAGQIARNIDPYQHDVNDRKSLSGTAINAIRAQTPGLSQGLPIRYSVYGNPMRNGASITGVHTVIPGLEGNSRPETTDPTEIELNRLAKTTPSAVITPVQKTIKFKGEEPRKLTTSEFEEYQHQAGRAIVDAVGEYMSDPSWGDMSDYDKIKVIKKIETQQKKQVKEQLFGQQ